MGSTPGTAPGIVLPGEALEAIEQAAAESQPGSAPSGPTATPVGFAGGVSAIPVDFCTNLQVSVLAPGTPGLFPSSVTLAITGKILNSDGSITNQYWSYNFAPSAGLLVWPELAPGYLLSVTATCQTAGIPSGALFCVAGLVHQTGSRQPLDMTLISAYLSSSNPVAWPSGVLHDISDGAGFYFEYEGTSAPLGSAWTYYIVDQYLMPQTISFEFVTSSTAANRYPYVELTLPPAPAVFIGVAAVAQTASQSWYYTFGTGLAWESGAPNIIELLALQSELMLNPGSNLTINCYQFQSGDQIVNPVIQGRAWS